MVWSFTYSQMSWNVKSSGPKKASLQTKLVDVMEFQLTYFKSWKMMLWKCCTQYASKFGKLSSGYRTEKSQFSFQSLRKAMPKKVQTTTQLHSSHTLAKWCSKFLQARLTTIPELWTFRFNLVLEKAEEPEINLPSVGSSKKHERSRKTSISALLTIPKPWTLWITINCGNSERDGNTRPPDLLLDKSLCRSGSNN